MNKVIDQLTLIVGKKNILTEQKELTKYSKDWRGFYNNKSLCVVFPINTKTLKEIVIFCNGASVYRCLEASKILSKKNLDIKVFNCPGVNHYAVAEHVFSLLLAHYKNLINEINFTRSGKWNRLIGQEIYGKSIGVVGLGRIGKQVLKRAKSFGLECLHVNHLDAEKAYTDIKDLIKSGTSVIVVNSVCGCAAANARPGVLESLQNEKLPNNLFTVFAGVDKEATESARSLMFPFPPSSPSIALFKDGELVHMLERHHIEGRDASLIAENLKQAYNEYC